MDKWLEYWQQDDLQPDVFTDSQGNKHASLLQFWQKHIAGFSIGSSILDIASGAGAIYRCLPNIAEYEAHALDISADALLRLARDMPSINTHSSGLDDTSFQCMQFDVVVSQFGIEYLGDDGFKHVPRLLKNKGKCIFLSHIKGGVVDAVTEQSLKGLNLVVQSKFLSLARDVAYAFNRDDKAIVEQAVKHFMQVEPTIAEYCQMVPRGHHAHLYNGIKQLLSHYNKYDHQTVIEWMDTASKQALENMERLQSMHNAALSIDDIYRLSESLSKQGLEIVSAEPFCLRSEDPPAAWEIIGVKRK